VAVRWLESCRGTTPTSRLTPPCCQLLRMPRRAVFTAERRAEKRVVLQAQARAQQAQLQKQRAAQAQMQQAQGGPGGPGGPGGAGGVSGIAARTRLVPIWACPFPPRLRWPRPDAPSPAGKCARRCQAGRACLPRSSRQRLCRRSSCCTRKGWRRSKRRAKTKVRAHTCCSHSARHTLCLHAHGCCRGLHVAQRSGRAPRPWFAESMKQGVTLLVRAVAAAQPLGAADTIASSIFMRLKQGGHQAAAAMYHKALQGDPNWAA